MNKVAPSRPEIGPLLRFCRIIRWLLLAFLVVQIGFFILAWLIPMPLTIGPVHMHVKPDGMTVGAVGSLSTVQKCAGVLVGLPGLLLLSYGLIRLGKSLTGFEQGRIFAAETITSLRSAAGATLLSIVLFSLEEPLRGIAFNVLGDGHRYPVAIDVSSNELLLILVCSLFYLIVGVMHEGRRLSEENEGFI
jgi:hypothetical protein